MKFFNLLSLSLLLAVASAAAVPGVEGVEGTIINDAASPVNNLDDKRDHCRQVCLNNQMCGGKCPRCDKKSLTCKA
ncbi:UPF0499 protein NFIA_054990 [Aspergillus udagawae]|uniref:UPF0499 protein NFIA_054990 n=1 Tax=Aspergillus udagawae TaxID=91492 RepID=A0ABQ1A1V6_9EURO|nr:UPF0499 protein NFIA_054990 [Aspergillus udagawae]GFF71569.1 UPF0499 protein NFIA_054990 [Aspergillus udagawae]GFG09283.1 UPF0499 protein NFIA_054990 [Aspergillus udagawae]GFG24362.1 UPF0499 protein NFIA_054990 [Aspergillus udagawae]